MRDQVDALKADPRQPVAVLNAPDHSYEATRARAEAAMVASRQVLRPIEPRPHHDATRHSGHSDQACRARATAALEASQRANQVTRARAEAALRASDRALYRD